MNTDPNISQNIPKPAAPAPAPPYHYIDTAEAQEAAVSSLRALSIIGVDTEGASLYQYRDRVSLIQITGGGETYLFDPLSLPTPSPLAEIFEARSILKIFHGADYDIASLKRDFGCGIGPLFDTALAARAIGLPSYSLGSLVLHYFGFTLSKIYQKSDWSQRPLSTAQKAYAACDTTYLIALYEILSAAVREKGRQDQMEEECPLMEAIAWTDKPFDANSYLRIQGASALPGEAQRVLRELVGVRDELAQKRNVPAFRIIDNDTLVLMARSRPQNQMELERLFPRKSAVVHRNPALWISAVQRGLCATAPLPRSERGSYAPMTPHQRTWLARLQAWRADQSRSEGVEPAMVIPTEALREVVRQGAKSESALHLVAPLRKWQIRRYGAALLSLSQSSSIPQASSVPQASQATSASQASQASQASRLPLSETHSQGGAGEAEG